MPPIGPQSLSVCARCCCWGRASSRSCRVASTLAVQRRCFWSDTDKRICMWRWITTSGYHSLTHSLNHLLTYPLTHSLTHALTHLLTYPLTHSLTHSLIHLQVTLLSWIPEFVVTFLTKTALIGRDVLFFTVFYQLGVD